MLPFDPAQVKEVDLAIRTPEELRTLRFERSGKDKEWQDRSGLREFHLDAAKVAKVLEQLTALKASRWVSIAGGATRDQKLTAKDATLRIELTLDDGRSLVLTVGAPFEGLGYFAQTSTAPDAVFLLESAQVAPLMQGPGAFALTAR